MITDREKELATAWRSHFGQPLPILGAAEIVEKILVEHGALAPFPRSGSKSSGRRPAGSCRSSA